MKRIAFFTGLLPALLMTLSTFAQPTTPTVEEPADRRQIAESRAHLIDSPPQITGSAEALAEALDVPPGLLAGAQLTGPGAGAATFANLGVIEPTRGDSFGVLASGFAGTSAPEPGTDFSPFGASGDSVTLTLNLDAPEGANRLSFDFNFLSAEFPDFVGSIFNDTFTARVTDAGGTRTVAFASVNSSFFFAASGSRAGGSGYDIFTENPSGVDFSFGGGLPDAGVTDFQSVNVEVTGGGPVTVVFNIRDLGDGILDSAVVIDNLVLSSLEVVDPNPNLLEGPDVTDDPTRLATGGEPVQGVAADGVTRVLLRTTVPGPGTVEFSMDGSAPEDGGLSTVGADDRRNSVLVSTEETDEGFQAFALYFAPPEFNRGGDENAEDRSLTFSALFTPDDGDTLESELPFKIVRPPVVLVHGLWSNGGAWANFGLRSDSRFDVTVGDYKATHARSFAVNIGRPGAFIQEALTGMRNEKIAVTQVDVAGHSMGGILSRLHVGRANYKRNNNFQEGDLNKLLTLNTPHTGSPLANALVGVRSVLPNFMLNWLRSIMKAIDEGAIDDLAKGSAAVTSIPRTEVPAHALVGIGGSDLTGDALALVPGNIGLIFKILNFLDDNTDIFAGIQHDLIVGRRSQEGGMPAGATSIFDGFESIHTSVTSSGSYSTRVIQLFNTSTDTAEFAEFPATAGLPLTGDAALTGAQIADLEARLESVVVVDGITITAPTSGTTVVAGDTLTVSVAAQNGFALDEVLVGTSIVAEVIEQAPFTVALPIPADAVGTFELLAFGTDGMGNFTQSQAVSFTVLPPAALTAVEIINRDPVLFGLGTERRLFVYGNYADGLRRDISDPSTGTFYQTSNPFIATVSQEGIVTATGPGVVTIVARHGGRQDSVSVTVFEVTNQPPIANAGEDRTVECTAPDFTAVILNGSGSFDPDDDPLTFLWSGPFGTASGVMPEVLLPLGSNNVSLLVDDGNGGTDTDDVLITVADSTPPDIDTATASPDSLWPPNHKMVEVNLTVEAVDLCSVEAPLCSIVGVTGDEPIEGDFEITGLLTIELRAERLGQEDGRVYSVEVACIDSAGNTSATMVDVVVPHDQR